MEKRKFTQSMAAMACSTSLAQSRMNPKKWISKVSGERLSLKKAADIMMHEVTVFEAVNNKIMVDFAGCEAELMKSLLLMGHITSVNAECITYYNKKWQFFKDMSKSKGIKIPVYYIHDLFIEKFGPIARREFYTELNEYLIENEIEHKYFNRRVNAKLFMY